MNPTVQTFNGSNVLHLNHPTVQTPNGPIIQGFKHPMFKRTVRQQISQTQKNSNKFQLFFKSLKKTFKDFKEVKNGTISRAQNTPQHPRIYG